MIYHTLSRAAVAALGGLALLAMASSAVAQTAQTVQATQQIMAPAPINCAVPARDLYRGLSDASLFTTDIATLQAFLATQGYFSLAPTGYFGPITFAALQKFQVSHGVPGTGYFGPLSRAAMQRVCGTTPPPPSAVSVWSISPVSGAVGAQISLTGFGFTSDNTVLMDGMVAARNVPISSSIAIACTTSPSCHGGINQTIEFAIPDSLSPNCPAGSMCPMFLRQMTPGTYVVTVNNANGTSNALTLTVVGPSTTGAPTITGLDTPTTLSLGQSGTWTVHASLASDSTANLHYSVVWGDENTATSGSIMAPAPTTIQTSATFTHAYAHSGTYTPVFTVTNDTGQSVTTSASIVITPLY